MEQLLANLSGSVRRTTLNGREYLVAPLTLIVPGVLNGSKGPLYYPPEEIARNAEAWNGMPLVVYHPNRNGVNVSARHPEIIESQGIGHVYNATVSQDGKLKAEGWFDLKAAARVDNRVLKALEAGNKIELSTGLFTQNDSAPQGAVYNGKPYTFIARNYRPDHLAILPDQVGACSLQDGCGVLVNEGNTVSKQTLWQRLGEMLGITSNEDKEGKCAECGKENCTCKPVENASPYKVRVRNIGSGDKAGAIAWAEDETGKTVYKSEEFPANEISKAIASVRTWVAAKAKELKEGNVINEDLSQTSGGSNSVEEGKPDMAKLTANERTKLVDELVSNGCGCWKDSDKEVLNKFSDERLQELVDNSEKSHENELLANAVKKHLGENITVNAMPAALAKAQAAKAGKKSVEPPAEEEEEVEEEEEEVMNSKPKTAQEWLAVAPPEIRSAVTNAMRIEGEEKQKLVTRLTANVGDKKVKERLTTNLAAKSLDELRDLVLLAPPVQNEGITRPMPTPLFYGQAPVGNSVTANDDADDFLALPTMNFAKAEKAAAN